jgi:hypothetical protein
MARRRTPKDPDSEKIVRDQRKNIRSEERSIAMFNDTVSDFTTTIKGLQKSIGSFEKSVNDFTKSVKDNKKVSEDNKKENKKNGGAGRGGGATVSAKRQWAGQTQVGIKKFENAASKLGYDRLNKFTSDVFGKRTAQRMTKGMARFTGMIGPKGGAGGFGKGMLGRAAGGLGSMAGGLLRLAGPIGAILSVGKMIFDFWDSGGFAKSAAKAKMIFGGNMKGAKGVASTRKNLEGTKQFREIDAKYAYIKPLEEQQARQKELYDWQAGNEKEMLGFRQSLIKDEIGFQMDLQKDAMSFAHQQAMENLDAELDRRKTLQSSGIKFAGNYLSLSERALRAIGSSTKAIIEGVSKFQTIFGASTQLSFKLSENAQGLAYHFGAGAEDVMNMTNLFRLMGKTSAETAQNLIGGITKFAEINDLAPQAIFAQIKEAGEDIYKFSSGTAENFVRQAAMLSKMSVSMSQMMKASDTMVLNYKDSIKAEMSLSAMLGKNVNLSEVRAKLMAGDQAGAAGALKSALGGVDIAKMNPFAKQQLMQATGMDISALMGIQQGKGGGVKGGLNENESAGAQFAKGALKQDVANAASKLALEQAQRKKLLEFEQKQRLANLLVEQSMRLESIQLEAEQRAYWTFKFEKDFEKDQAAAAMNAEAATSIFVAKQQRQILESELKGMGIGMSGPGGSQIAQGLSAIQKLQEEGRISADQNAEFQKSLAAEIMKVKDVKDEKQVAAAMETAMGKTLKPVFQQRQSDVDAKVNRIVEIAKNAQNLYGDDWKAYKKKNNVTDEEYMQARSIMNERTGKNLALFGSIKGNQGSGRLDLRKQVKADATGLNQAAIEELRKGNSISFQSQVAENANKPQVEALKLNATKVEAANNKVADNQAKLVLEQTRTLSEAEYNTKIQLEQVALLGLSTQILAKIMENTKGDGDIVLDGKAIRANLIAQSRRNYGVGRTEKVA